MWLRNDITCIDYGWHQNANYAVNSSTIYIFLWAWVLLWNGFLETTPLLILIGFVLVRLTNQSWRGGAVSDHSYFLFQTLSVRWESICSFVQRSWRRKTSFTPPGNTKVMLLYHQALTEAEEDRRWQVCVLLNSIPRSISLFRGEDGLFCVPGNAGPLLACASSLLFFLNAGDETLWSDLSSFLFQSGLRVSTSQVGNATFFAIAPCNSSPSEFRRYWIQEDFRALSWSKWSASPVSFPFGCNWNSGPWLSFLPKVRTAICVRCLICFCLLTPVYNM